MSSRQHPTKLMSSHFLADLHIHSRFSRATSQQLNVRTLAQWALCKGIGVLGTGDFTHPQWRAELAQDLDYDEQSGLFRAKTAATLPPEVLDMVRDAARPQERNAQPLFMLQAEISSIYKRHGKVRKVHNLVYMPSFASAERLCRKLEAIGNLTADGRPILGLDSRDLLEMVLDTDPRAALIPAHVWTPWFSLFGSRSGFDSLEECFDDLRGEIFAMETGLSSDPAMNRLWSGLDHCAFISNSDAHSPANLGREVNRFAGTPSYDGIFNALRQRTQSDCRAEGTVEFFPEEGKYHLDGHRECKVCLTPEESTALGNICPVCGKPLTIGVLNRVMALADRTEAHMQPRDSFASLIPLAELVGECLGVGAQSKKAQALYADVVGTLGPELEVLLHTPVDDLRKKHELLGEAVDRMRRGKVVRHGGFDGQYGVVRVFEAHELHARQHKAQGSLLACGGGQHAPAVTPRQERESTVAPPEGKTAGSAGAVGSGGSVLHTTPTTPPAPAAHAAQGSLFAPLGTPAAVVCEADRTTPPEVKCVAEATSHGAGCAGTPERADTACHAESRIDRLEQGGAVTEDSPAATSQHAGTFTEEQRAALLHEGTPCVVVAGPGTGKTHTLTGRVGALLDKGVEPSRIMVLTFTRRAAEELRERLTRRHASAMAVLRCDTLHAIALAALGQAISPLPQLIGEDIAQTLFATANPQLPAASLRRAWDTCQQSRETLRPLAAPWQECATSYARMKEQWRCWDYTDILEAYLHVTAERPVPSGAAAPHVLVDEMQDLSPLQWRIILQLAGDGSGFFGIGDPRQSIYGFRGAQADAIQYVRTHWPHTVYRTLTHSWRSSQRVLDAAHALLPAGDAHLTCPRVKPGGLYLCRTPSDGAEARWIADRIHALLGGTSHSLEDQHSAPQSGYWPAHPLAPSDIAVLVRTRAQMAGIAKALQMQGIPHTVPELEPYWHDAVVQRVLTYAVLRGSGEGLVPQGTWAAATADYGQDKVSSSQKNLTQAAAPFPSVTEAQWRKGPQGLEAALQEAGCAPALHWKSAAWKRFTQAWRTAGSWEALARETALLQDVECVRAHAERVQIMTMHASKGLEFEAVFIAGAEEGLLPYDAALLHPHWQGAKNSAPYPLEALAEPVSEEESTLRSGLSAQRASIADGSAAAHSLESADGTAVGRRAAEGAGQGRQASANGAGNESGNAPEYTPNNTGHTATCAPDHEEEQRLLYVAVTRAASLVFISYARERHWQGQSLNLAPSPLLAALRPHCHESEMRKIHAVKARQLTLL